MFGTLLGAFFSSLFNSLVKGLNDWLSQQQRDQSQREIERLQLANNALTQEKVQSQQRQAVQDEVARLSDDDLFKRLRT